MNDKKRSIGFGYAWNGLKQVWLTERNFRFHTIFAIIIMIASVFFRLSPIEWICILFCIGFVIVTEIVNTVIEKLLDYLKPEIHPKAKVIKDISASAVLIASTVSAMIGLIIFLPKILLLF